jgi:hypothetical protein
MMTGEHLLEKVINFLLAAIYIMARSRYKWKAAWISGAI